MNKDPNIQRFKKDPEFERLIPPLTEEEYSMLRDSLLGEEGCRDPLVAWSQPEGYLPVLLDGHNRHKICDEFNIEFDVVFIDLPSRDAAIAWIIRNQLARRNLRPDQRIDLAKRLEKIFTEDAKKRQGTRSDLNFTQDLGESEMELTEEKMDEVHEEDRHSRETAARTAKVAGVSRETVRKLDKVEEIAPELAEEIRNGNLKIDAAYRQAKGIQKPEWIRVVWNNEYKLADYTASVDAPKINVDNAFLQDILEDQRVDHVMIYFKPKEEEPEALTEQPPLSEVLDF